MVLRLSLGLKTLWDRLSDVSVLGLCIALVSVLVLCVQFLTFWRISLCKSLVLYSIQEIYCLVPGIVLSSWERSCLELSWTLCIGLGLARYPTSHCLSLGTQLSWSWGFSTYLWQVKLWSVALAFLHCASSFTFYNAIPCQMLVQSLRGRCYPSIHPYVFLLIWCTDDTFKS